MDNVKFTFTRVSGNSKTGPIPVTMSGAQTCPDACPLSKANGGGCYAASGMVAIHWRKVTEGRAGMSWGELLDNIRALPKGTFFRHNVAGDLPTAGNDRIAVDLLAELVKAAKGRKGFTYTHYPVTANPDDDNAAAVRHANDNGFTINLSGNNPGHADTLAALGIGPVVTLLPEGSEKVSQTPEGRKVVVCPAVSSDKVTCATCQLCADPSRSYIIGFPVHGVQKKKAARLIPVNQA